MSMFNESDWETPCDMGYDPCNYHDHCDLCGICGDENELVQERLAGEKSVNECLPCRVKALTEDCRE